MRTDQREPLRMSLTVEIQRKANWKIRLKGAIMARKLWLLAGLFTFCIASMKAQKDGRSGEFGTVEGYVICSDGNVPARQATVRLIPLATLLPDSHSSVSGGQTEVETSTDFNGYYTFPAVASGTYIIDVRSNGYADDLDLVRLVLERFNREQKQNLLSIFPQIAVASFSSVSKNVNIHRGGIIAGRVSVDIGGVPGTTKVTATLVASSILGDLTTPESRKAPSFSRSATTDDRGNFRIAGLPAGKYRLSVRLTEAYFELAPGNGATPTLRPRRIGTAELVVFAPQTIEQSEASLIEVRDGDEIADANIAIPMRTLHSIEGTVLRSGIPLPGVAIAIQRAGHDMQPANAVSDSNGRFRFDLLPDGAYALWANSSFEKGLSDCADCRKTTIIVNDHDVLGAILDISPLPARP